MASGRAVAVPAAVVVAAAATWYVWTYQGKRHRLTLEDTAYSDLSYDVYAHWATHRPEAHVRHYPVEMGPNCLPAPYQNQDGALSTRSARNNEESPYG